MFEKKVEEVSLIRITRFKLLENEKELFIVIRFYRSIFEKVVVEIDRIIILKIKIESGDMDLLGRVKFYK